jgi:hypothetical protein
MSELVRDGVADEVAKLKEQPGKDLAVRGAGLASTLIKLGPIDEYRLFVRSSWAGGTQYFPALEERINLELVETQTFRSPSLRSLPAGVRRPVGAHPRVRSLVGSATSSRAAPMVAIASDASERRSIAVADDRLGRVGSVRDAVTRTFAPPGRCGSEQRTSRGARRRPGRASGQSGRQFLATRTLRRRRGRRRGVHGVKGAIIGVVSRLMRRLGGTRDEACGCQDSDTSFEAPICRRHRSFTHPHRGSRMRAGPRARGQSCLLAVGYVR